MLRVELAALEEVIIEGEEDLVEEGGTLPEVITSIGGLMGRIALGKIIPGSIAADLPEDGPSPRSFARDATSLRTG
jgi:hypothetical protein